MSSSPVEKPKDHTHTLAYPVSVEGRDVTEVTLRRLKGKDFKKMDGREGVDGTFFLLQELSGLPPETFDEMDGEDINALSKVVEGFIGKRRRS